LQADAVREVYVELPEEDREEGMCGRLLKSMYGTRDAAFNWETTYREFLEDCGFKTGRASACKYALVHIDEFNLLPKTSDSHL
jgi:hypothetical protein